MIANQESRLLLHYALGVNQFDRPSETDRLPLLGNGDLILLGEVPRRILTPIKSLGDGLEAMALGSQCPQLARLVGLPRLLVPLEMFLAHTSTAPPNFSFSYTWPI